MGITKEGIEGEQMMLSLLRNRGYKCFQPDVIGLINNKYYVFEVKRQDRFNAPPFEGHGLPLWQVRARLEFQKATGVIAILVVFDKETNEVFYQRLDVLEKGKYFDTKNKDKNRRRRVYPLEQFEKLNGSLL